MAEDTAPDKATPPEPIGPAGVAAPDSSWADTAPSAPTSTMTAPPPSMAAPAPAVSQAPAASSIDPASAAQMHSDGLMGRAAHFLLGTQTKYAVDPATGKMVQTQVSQAPGQLFKSILAGAILGGAAGAQDTTGSGLKGAAMGGGAVIAHNEAQDQLQQKGAREDFQQAQQADAAKQQKLMQQATIAHMNVQDLHSNAELDLASQEHLDKLNDYNQIIKKATVDQGGQETPITVNGKNINGEAGNGAAVMQAYTQDPRSMDAPNGMHRVHTQSVDYSDLHFDAGKGWVDQDNDPVDLASKTTHTFYDIPENIFKKQVTMSGADLNKLTNTNSFKPDQNLSVGYGDLLALKTQSTEDALKVEKAQRDKEQSQIGFMNAASQRMNAVTESKKQAFAEKLNGEDEDSLVKGITAPTPTVDIYSDSSLRAGRREALIKKALAQDPNFSEPVYKNKLAMIKNRDSGELSKTVKQFNTFLGHTADMSNGVQELRNHSLALANTPLNKLRKMTGDPAVSNFLTKIDASKTEFLKVLSNGHALTDADKHTGDELVNENMSPAQIQGQAKTFGHTGLVQLGSANQQYRNVMGSNIGTLLSDDGRQAVRDLGLSDVATHYAKDELPPQAAAQLKPGQETAFNNGQVWTSYNGQPVRLK